MKRVKFIMSGLCRNCYNLSENCLHCFINETAYYWVPSDLRYNMPEELVWIKGEEKEEKDISSLFSKSSEI